MHITRRGVTVSKGRHRPEDRGEYRELGVRVADRLKADSFVSVLARDLLAEFPPELIDELLDPVEQVAVLGRDDPEVGWTIRDGPRGRCG